MSVELPGIKEPVQMTAPGINFSSSIPSYGSKRDIGKALLTTLTQPSDAIRDRKGPTDWVAAYNSHLKLSEKITTRPRTREMPQTVLSKNLTTRQSRNKLI